MSEPSLQNVSFSFGDNVILKDASFDMQKGEKAGLVGPNGCGKTTLLNLVFVVTRDVLQAFMVFSPSSVSKNVRRNAPFDASVSDSST